MSHSDGVKGVRTSSLTHTPRRASLYPFCAQGRVAALNLCPTIRTLDTIRGRRHDNTPLNEQEHDAKGHGHMTAERARQEEARAAAEREKAREAERKHHEFEASMVSGDPALKVTVFSAAGLRTPERGPRHVGLVRDRRDGWTAERPVQPGSLDPSHSSQERPAGADCPQR
jgi:hypothetical protein